MTSSYDAFRQKLGLDYLIKGSKNAPPAGQTSAQQFIDAALQASGIKLLTALKKADSGTVQLHALVQPLEMDLETLLRVVDYLSEQGFVQILKRDDFGNHTIQITESGKKVPV
jgi:hypothetical protein